MLLLPPWLHRCVAESIAAVAQQQVLRSFTFSRLLSVSVTLTELPLVGMAGGAAAEVAGLGFWGRDRTLETTATGEGGCWVLGVKAPVERRERSWTRGEEEGCGDGEEGGGEADLPWRRTERQRQRQGCGRRRGVEGRRVGEVRPNPFPLCVRVEASRRR